MRLLIIGSSHVRTFFDTARADPDLQLCGQRVEPLTVALKKPSEVLVVPTVPGERDRSLGTACPLVEGFAERLVPLMDDADHVLLLWGGGGINRLTWGGGPPFDFVAPDGTAPAPRTLLLPYSAMEKWGESIFEHPAPEIVFSTFWSAIEPYPQSQKVVFLVPPPPLPERALRERLASQPALVERARNLNLDVRELPLATDELRRKAWVVVRRVYERMARQCERRAVPPPDEAFGPDGMLAPPFWGPDINHANGTYGRLYLEKVVETLTRPEAELLAPV